MAILNSVDLLNILSNLLSASDFFGTTQENRALASNPVVQNATASVSIVANVFTIGGVASILALPNSERANAVTLLKQRIELLVPFLENELKNPSVLHAKVNEFLNTVNTLPFALGALNALQSNLECFNTYSSEDKAIIAEFFGCAMPEYTASDLLIALSDEIQRGFIISDNDWQSQPFMPLEELTI